MEFKIGDKVQYSFPNAVSSSMADFSGDIQSISESFIIIRNEKNIQLKISFKNFDLIKPFNAKVSSIKHSENYYG